MVAKTEVEAWSFLISNIKTQDYVTVVAPDFLIEAGIPDLIKQHVRGDVTEAGTVKGLRISDAYGNTLSLLYRITVATGVLVGQDTDILRDRFARRILLIEGVAVKTADAIAISEQDFAQVRAECLDAFRQLWNSETIPPPVPSTPRPLAAEEGGILNVMSDNPVRVSVAFSPQQRGQNQQLLVPEKTPSPIRLNARNVPMAIIIGVALYVLLLLLRRQ